MHAGFVEVPSFVQRNVVDALKALLSSTGTPTTLSDTRASPLLRGTPLDTTTPASSTVATVATDATNTTTRVSLLVVEKPIRQIILRYDYLEAELRNTVRIFLLLISFDLNSVFFHLTVWTGTFAWNVGQSIRSTSHHFHFHAG